MVRQVIYLCILIVILYFTYIGQHTGLYCVSYAYLRHMTMRGVTDCFVVAINEDPVPVIKAFYQCTITFVIAVKYCVLISSFYRSVFMALINVAGAVICNPESLSGSTRVQFNGTNFIILVYNYGVFIAIRMVAFEVCHSFRCFFFAYACFSAILTRMFQMTTNMFH